MEHFYFFQTNGVQDQKERMEISDKRVLGTIPPASNLGLLKGFILTVNNAAPH